MANKERDSLSTDSSDSEIDEDKEIIGTFYVCNIYDHIYIDGNTINSIKVSDLRQVCGLLRVLRFPPPINLTTIYS